MRVVLMGTPEFSVYALKALLSSRHTLVAVISQPDKAKDRKGNLLHTPLKAAAVNEGIDVLQFNSIKKEGVETLKNLNADIFVTAAYGQILSREILDIPKHGVINIHASLLPKYRGSSPIECAVLNGDKTTGITIMQTAEGLDCGDIIMAESTQIGSSETAAELTVRLAQIGANLLLRALDDIENSSATFTKQDENKASKCGKITKDMCKIDWTSSAKNIHNKVRALPAFTTFRGRLIKILQTALLDIPNDNVVDFRKIDSKNDSKDCSNKNDLSKEYINRDRAGQILADKSLNVYCGGGMIEVLRLTPEGGKPMSGKDFLLGVRPLDDTAKFD